MKIILHSINGEVKLLKKVRGSRRFREATCVIELIAAASKTGKEDFLALLTSIIWKMLNSLLPKY